jgi:hypothetical protein
MPLLALLPILTTLAPSLLRHLAGDQAAQVAERVTETVRAVVGSDDPARIAAAIADPQKAGELTLALARIEHEAAIEQQRMILADVANARGQTVELAKAKSPIAYGAVIVSCIVLAAYGVAVWVALWRPVPEGSRDMLMLLLGNLATMAASAVAYWVGSSAGSAQRARELAEVREQLLGNGAGRR